MIEGNGTIKTFKLKFTISNRITSGLTRIERARGFLEAAALSEAEPLLPANTGEFRTILQTAIMCENRWSC